jgi:hypothetical protein
MSYRKQSRPVDYTANRADWQRLALRTHAALAEPELSADDRSALGDLAALALNTWTYPVAGPEGRIARLQAEGVITWARQASPELAMALARGVDWFTDALLQLLTLVGTPVLPPPEASTAARRYRADIDG